MAVAVPLMCLAALLLAHHGYSQRSGTHEWRQSLLGAAVLWGVLVVAITESLSLFSSLRFFPLLAVWSLLMVASSVAFLWLRRPAPTEAAGSPGMGSGLPGLPGVLLIGIGAIFAAVGLIALAAPPNNWDSMTYHMPRVMHWMQDQNLSHYPTPDARQLYSPPWAEFVLLHLQILSGGDHFANLLQWFSMVGAVIGVSVIAKQLGADLRGQVLAAVIAATIPEGILQGSTTMNDYVVGFWLVCCVHYLLAFRETPNWGHALGVGASVGLAILTKGTAYFYATPFVLVAAVWAARQHPRGLGKLAVAIIGIALSLNAGLYARNLALFGHPLVPQFELHRLPNDGLSPATLLSNTSRNLALELNTPSDRVNVFVQERVKGLHALLRLDVNDPRTTWPGTAFDLSTKARLFAHEDNAGNPVHVLLLAAAMALGLTLRSIRTAALAAYALALLAAFFIFSGYFKWQPWNTRIFLPLLVLAAPLTGAVLARAVPRQLTNGLALLLLLVSLPWILNNSGRPLVGDHSVFRVPRAQQYFVNHPDLEAPYVAAAKIVRVAGCSNLGLFAKEDDWEYPLWVVLDRGNQPMRQEHVRVDNDSARLDDAPRFADFHPCAIVALTPPREGRLGYHGRSYARVWSLEPVSVLISPSFPIGGMPASPAPS